METFGVGKRGAVIIHRIGILSAVAGVVDLGYGETARVKPRMHSGKARSNAGDETAARAEKLPCGYLGMDHAR